MKKTAILLSVICMYSCSSTNKSTDKTETVVNEVVDESTAASAGVFFKHPADGATVPSPVFIEMGVSGMEIEPAGEVREGYGHHHILINQLSWPEGTLIPASDSTIHFGKGQTDASLDLPAGEYTIALQFADGVHSSYGESMAATISITVE